MKRRLQTATLEDDVEAEGVMLPPMWVYTRLNEAVMVRVWDQYKGDVATDWNGKNSYQNNCFRFCDMVMAAGQGHAIDTKSHESLSRRAAGSLQMATLATSDAALSERAEHYLKVQLW